MKSQWKTLSLGEAIELKRGYDLPSRERQPGTVPVVSSSGISDYHSAAMVKGPGVVTGRYGTIGQVFYVREDFWPLNTALYVRDFKGNEPRFIHYFLQTLDFLAYSDKAAVPGINRNHLHQAIVMIPPLLEQRAIAAILGALDDKIELNRQMNRTLEAMAQALFKSWFVDFDPVRAKAEGRATGLPDEVAALFPDRLVESELGEIPEGWNVVSLAQIMDIKGGTQPPSSEFITEDRLGYVRLVQIRDYESDAHLTFIPDNPKLRKCVKEDVMIARYGAAVARICWGLDGAYNVALVKAEPIESMYREYLRSYLQSDYFQTRLIGMSSRSAQAGFNKGDIASFHLRVPYNVVLLEIYQKSSWSLREKILQNNQETSILVSMRDTLLPKLISGEVRVKDVDNYLLMTV